MSQKILLIAIGSILLLLGIMLLVAASQHEWESNEYKKVTGKEAPTNLKNNSNIVGAVLTVIGVGLLGWGIAIHTGMAPHLKK